MDRLTMFQRVGARRTAAHQLKPSPSQNASYQSLHKPRQRGLCEAAAVSTHQLVIATGNPPGPHQPAGYREG